MARQVGETVIRANVAREATQRSGNRFPGKLPSTALLWARAITGNGVPASVATSEGLWVFALEFSNLPRISAGRVW